MMMPSSNSLQLVKPMTSVKVVAPTNAQAPTTTSAAAASRGVVGGSSSEPSTSSSSNSNNNNHVDFIGPSNAVKHLFSLPYNSDRNVSVALHNMGNGTLLLDSGEDFGGVTTGGGEGGGAPAAFSPRSSRRRQRPRNWSTVKAMEDQDEDDTAEEEMDRSQLAQLREGERSLLASLSLLLEEEKRQKPPTHHDSGAVSEDSDGDAIHVVSPREKIMLPPDNSNEKALVVPSNAIVLANNLTTEPIVNIAANAAQTTAQINSNNTRGDPTNIDDNDPLAAKLPSPQHYLSHVVAPPTEPRQYVDWKFRDMKMLIASDTVIYNQGEGGPTRQQQPTGNTGSYNVVEDEDNATTKSDSIAIRVADASDLRSQMKYHETMVKEGLFVQEEGIYGRRSQLALPSSSYAEALKLTAPSGENNEVDEDGNAPTKRIGENVKLQSSIISASGGAVVGPEWAHLGYSISAFPPPAASTADAVVEDAGNDAISSGVGNTPPPPPKVGAAETNGERPPSSSPVCTVLDTYLDNLMANVPQLALILREHGFVQNIKLLRTEDIPSLMMHPSTLGVDVPMQPTSNTSSHNPPPPVFEPDIVEMNAAMLLRFLKANCTRENSTYLLRRAANTTNIQLFDITSISERRVQRKWVWWLALCSYRFACRLEQLQVNVSLQQIDGASRREYRNRQRSLLHNTLNLLEELADMDDDDDDNNNNGRGGRTGRHETIGAAVCEHLADTYLWNNDEQEADGDFAGLTRRDSEKSTSNTPAPCASSSQPYRNVTVDCLDKAHDHLMNGIKKLTPLLEKAKQNQGQDKKNGPPSIEVEAISTQLYGIHHKIVNVCLRLADHHLKNYFSSNLIRSLRTAARTLADATSLLVDHLGVFEFCGGGSRTESNPESIPDNSYARSILLQHAWLWEYCGHFARSFAADELWRDRGHTCGADLVGLFREVNASCVGVREACFGKSSKVPKTTCSVRASSHGQVSLDSLSGLVILPHDFERIEASVLQKKGCHEAIGAARAILNRKTQIKRDARQVLVAACVCYGHAIDSYVFLAEQREEGGSCGDSAKKNESDGAVDGLKKNILSMSTGGNGAAPVVAAPLLRQRLGDACNEIGQILLSESRAVLLPQFSPPNDIRLMMANGGKSIFGMSHVSAIMLASAQFWFLDGLARFTEGKDLRNLALLRCNLCQCCKIRANTNVILPGSSLEDPSSLGKKKSNSESYLQEAVDHLVAAHDAMGQRDADPVTWDMVSEELAATLLVLGVRRRQSTLSSSSPEPLILQAMRLTPGAEKAIVEPMERSCAIYESLGTPKANHQAAAAHYQLALYFSKVWTCQRDEARTREKLAAAFEHYGAAHRYFFRHVRGNEATFVVLSLDFSNLYSAVSGEEECLSKALRCCLDTRAAFSFPALPHKAMTPALSSTMEQIATLSESIEARVSKLLLSLVKIEKGKKSNLKAAATGPKLLLPSDKYTNMYRKVLGFKMMSGNKQSNEQDEGNGWEDPSSPTFPIFELLETLSEGLS